MGDAALWDAARVGAAAFVIALSGAMAPGPFLTVTIAQTAKHGRRAAFLLLAGHALLEAVLLVGFAFGLQHFLRLPSVATVLAVLGGAVLLWMGGDLLLGAARGTLSLHTDPTVAPPSRFGPVVQGAVVSLSNPYWTLWWATIGVKLAADGLAIGALGIAAFFVGHQLGDAAWYGLVAQTVHGGRRFLSPPVYRSVMGVCASLLLVLGALFLLRGVGLA
jgi:threonine/homoserine/homoserine lactone efflux protein